MDDPERPSAVREPVALDDPDRLGDALVGLEPGIAQVVQPAQDVVVPPGREREPEPVGIDHLAGRLPPKEPALEHVRLAAATRLPHPLRAADRPLVREQALEDVDRRPERRHRRAVLDLAVPAAVRELLAEEPLDQRRHVHAEVGAGRDDVAVDARLDLALEEPLRRPGRVPPGAIAPRDVVADETDRSPRLLARRVEPEPSQELQHVERVGPVLRERVARPQAVRRLEGQQPRAPAVRGDARPLGCDDVRRLVGQVAHDLPADRGISVEQPVDDGHRRRLRSPPARCCG